MKSNEILSISKFCQFDSQLMTLMSAIDMNAILECKALRYLTNGFLVCYLYLNYCDLISVTEIDFGLVMQPILKKHSDPRRAPVNSLLLGH